MSSFCNLHIGISGISSRAIVTNSVKCSCKCTSASLVTMFWSGFPRWLFRRLSIYLGYVSALRLCEFRYLQGVFLKDNIDFDT
jgi:hypothetical protein